MATTTERPMDWNGVLDSPPGDEERWGAGLQCIHIAPTPTEGDSLIEQIPTPQSIGPPH